jgi:hypothetical protein
MAQSQVYVDMLKRNDPFREWLLDIMDERIRDQCCSIKVYRMEPSSHTVCRYEFVGEGISVMGKFFSEPTGMKRCYDDYLAMKNEFRILSRIQEKINVPKPLATRKDFNCILLTEYVQGRTILDYMNNAAKVGIKLEQIAKNMRKLHSLTQPYFDKEREFARFSKTIRDNNLRKSMRDRYNSLLNVWWNSSLMDRDIGCTVHDDATLGHYVFNEKCYALDFESSRDYAHPVHDLGIFCAELKNYFLERNRPACFADSLIGNFVKDYALGEDELIKTNEILPFYISLGLLRIARFKNSGHRMQVLEEALSCLKSGCFVNP